MADDSHVIALLFRKLEKMSQVMTHKLCQNANFENGGTTIRESILLSAESRKNVGFYIGATIIVSDTFCLITSHVKAFLFQWNPARMLVFTLGRQLLFLTPFCLITSHVKAFFFQWNPARMLVFTLGRQLMFLTPFCLITSHVKAFFFQWNPARMLVFTLGRQLLFLTPCFA